MDREIQVPLIKGATFLAYLTIPSEYPRALFDNWELKSEIRKRKNPTPRGFIDELDVAWAPQMGSHVLSVYKKDTSKWPTGPAEVDIMLISPQGEVVQSSKVLFQIIRGVTQK